MRPPLPPLDQPGPVRRDDALDWPRVEEVLRTRAESLELSADDLAHPMEVAQFPGGHSNLTYLVRFGSAERVLRRAPIGPLPPRAHDMAREHRWLSAVHPSFSLAPRPLLLCDDLDIAGAVFYLMDRRRGVVVRGDEPSGVAGAPAARRRMSDALVDTLAALHAVDATRPPLAGLGRPQGFVERQVEGWSDRWRHARTTEVPEMDRLIVWLREHLPPEPPTPAIVHGDFKLDNVMFDARDPGRLVGVFDWEMCALGDPLVDLGIFLAYWSMGSTGEGPDAAATSREGWMSRDEIVARYAERTGRDVSRLRVYETFALFKLAVVLQQLFARYARGQSTDPRYAGFDARVRALTRQAERMAMHADRGASV